jgi:hypothetical protein
VVAEIAQARVEHVLPIEQVQHRITAVLVGGVAIAVRQQHADLALVAEDRAFQRMHMQIAGGCRLARGGGRRGLGVGRTGDRQAGAEGEAEQGRSHRGSSGCRDGAQPPGLAGCGKRQARHLPSIASILISRRCGCCCNVMASRHGLHALFMPDDRR